MLSQLFVFRQSKNFTSDNGVRVPPTIPINHYFGSKNQQNRTGSPILLFHAEVFKPNLACHEHSILFTVMHVIQIFSVEEICITPGRLLNADHLGNT